MHKNEELSSLIGDVYDAAIDPSQWQAVLAKTRELFVGTQRERMLHDKHADRARTASAGAELRAQRRSPLRRMIHRVTRAMNRAITA